MTPYLVRRVALAVPLLFGIATVIFLLIHFIPGDPVEVMLGPGAGPGDVADLRHRLGLDRPLASQYAAYLGGLVSGDLGMSLRYRDPVASLIFERFPATILLAAASMLIALAVSFPAGIAAAIKPGGPFDRATALGSALALSIPSIWLGPLLILAFSIHLDWLPVSGFDTPLAVVLPASTLAVSIAALLTRMVRGSMSEEMAAAYLQAARSRGLSRRAAAVRHALRNALPPVLAATALQMGSLLTGAILTETIFAWPGLGRLLVQGIAHRDYPLVQGCVLAFATTYIALNLAADLCMAVLDPRVAA